MSPLPIREPCQEFALLGMSCGGELRVTGQTGTTCTL